MNEVNGVRVCKIHEDTVKEISRRVPIWVLMVLITIFVAMFGVLYTELLDLNLIVSEIDKRQGIILYQLKNHFMENKENAKVN